MSTKITNPTKAQLTEKMHEAVDRHNELLENYRGFAGDVQEGMTHISQAVGHALKLVRGLGDGTGACSSCLADDLKSILYTLESADGSIDVMGEQAMDIVEFYDPCDDDMPTPEIWAAIKAVSGIEDLYRWLEDSDTDPELVPFIQAEIDSRRHGNVIDAEYLANSDITDEGLSLMLDQHPEYPNWAVMIQAEIERRAGLRN